MRLWDPSLEFCTHSLLGKAQRATVGVVDDGELVDARVKQLIRDGNVAECVADVASCVAAHNDLYESHWVL